MKRKLSRVLPPDSFKGQVVVPFPEPKIKRPSHDEPTRQMFKFRLHNGFVGQVIVPASESNRLWYAVQEPDDFHHILLFDSFKHRIALNLNYVVASQFDAIGGSGLAGLWVDDSETVDIYFADSHTPLALDVGPDEMSIAEYDEGGIDDDQLCQLDSMFFYFGMAHTGSDDMVHLRDIEDADVWLRVNDVALLTAPLALLVEPPDQPEETTEENDNASDRPESKNRQAS